MGGSSASIERMVRGSYVFGKYGFVEEISKFSDPTLTKGSKESGLDLCLENMHLASILECLVVLRRWFFGK